MTKTLPFLVSIPHGGTVIPPEFKDRMALTERDLFDDSDVFSDEIYNVQGLVKHTVRFSFARAFIDVSRPVDERPPQYTDGVIKSHTCYHVPVYKKDMQPNSREQEMLIREYYNPYHAELQKTIKMPGIKIALDCHTMHAVGPAVSPDSGTPRPIINLGNLDGAASDMTLIRKLASAFCNVFQLDDRDVSLNKPFKGGYITRRYGGKPLPWIQIELNKSLYLASPWFDKPSLSMDTSRLTELNRLFSNVLYQFSQMI